MDRRGGGGGGKGSGELNVFAHEHVLFILVSGLIFGELGALRILLYFNALVFHVIFTKIPCPHAPSHTTYPPLLQRRWTVGRYSDR